MSCKTYLPSENVLTSGIIISHYLPFEKEQVNIVVFLCEEVAQNSSWVCRPDLVGRQGKIHTLDEIPQLSWFVTCERPATNNKLSLILIPTFSIT